MTSAVQPSRGQETQGTQGTPRPSSPALSQLPPVPASPSYSYASTANPANMSTYNLPAPPPPRPAYAVLTKSDLAASQSAYADLLSSAKSYRLALASLSTAASAFACALESCARLKEARAESLAPPAAPSLGLGLGLSQGSFTSNGSCTADFLLAAAGLHHLVANHDQILSETVYRSFEVPLLHELDKWRRAVDDEEEGYAAASRQQNADIRRLEKEGLKLHRQRRRDVARFRAHLVELTQKLDGLTALHDEHATSLLRESQHASARICDATCSLARAEVDIFEGLARKGWSGGGLEDLLEKGTDLFASQDVVSVSEGAAAGEGSKLFSILPPMSILADSASDTGGLARPAHHRADSLGVASDPYQSLAGAVSGGGGNDADSISVFSELNRSRLVRPFSPQPVPVSPDDVISVLGGDHTQTHTHANALAHDDTSRSTDGGGDTTRLTPGTGSSEGETSEPETIRNGPVGGGGIEAPAKFKLSPDGDEDEHPWRDEGRRGGDGDSVGTSASTASSEQRQGSWSATEDGSD